MKAVYSWDKDNHLDTINLVEDDYQLAPSETFTKPEDGLYEPISWTGSAWVGVSKEEWEAKHPQQPIEPTTQQKLDAQMQIQLAQLMKQNKEQAPLNARLTIDIASLKKQVVGDTKAAQ